MNMNKARYESMQRFGQSDPEAYWAEAALELKWIKPWRQTLEWNPPFARWFVDGTLNASVNCLDRHLETQAQKAALVWEGEPGEVVAWTYRELHYQTERLAAVFNKMGMKKGDRVAIYMPLIPESVVAMLACARAGLTHTVVFAGFSAEALKDRINDAEAKLVITADFGFRKGAKIALQSNVEEAIPHCPTLQHLLVIEREHAGKIISDVQLQEFKNLSGGTHLSGQLLNLPHLPTKKAASSTTLKEYHWHTSMASITQDEARTLGAAIEVDSEHPLFILYTSGTTGKPKGIVHSTGGYLTGVHRTSQLVFDLKPQDLFWCTADIGWITGHSYLVYGPLSVGAAIFMYEGAPLHPTPDRFWAMIERHRITHLYTAPTAIRTFMKLGDHLPLARDLSTLRLLGSVGEPINPEAWRWYSDVIGKGNCPVVDTFWQTETGAIIISAVPGVTKTKPGSATLPLPGFDIAVVDRTGKEVPVGESGLLVIRKPWPSMARTIHKDPERFKKTYFSEFLTSEDHSRKHMYFTGDGARMDEDGYFWALGRVDDVLNVSGHLLGTAEIESALVSHPAVAEAAVVGRPDEIKGQAVVAFVTLKLEAMKQFAPNGSTQNGDGLKDLKQSLMNHVAHEIGAFARPDTIRFAEGLPKTRSGKIMRRLLREVAVGGASTEIKGDTSTLEDLSALAALQDSDE